MIFANVDVEFFYHYICLYNHFHKKGGILAENSGYLISYLNEGRFDKLEEKIMAVVHAKIRQKIDAAKTKLKTEAFNKKFGK